MPISKKLSYKQQNKALDLLPNPGEEIVLNRGSDVTSSLAPRQLKGYEKTDGVMSYSIVCVISGAADKATGTDDRNRTLSIERAKYIGNQLMSRGVPKENLKATSLGGINKFTPKEANRFCVVLVK